VHQATELEAHVRMQEFNLVCGQERNSTRSGVDMERTSMCRPVRSTLLSRERSNGVGCT